MQDPKIRTYRKIQCKERRQAVCAIFLRGTTAGFMSNKPQIETKEVETGKHNYNVNTCNK